VVFISVSLKPFLFTLHGCLIPVFVIYFTLTYFLVPIKFTIPTAMGKTACLHSCELAFFRISIAGVNAGSMSLAIAR
jgi:hypothetical protein